MNKQKNTSSCSQEDDNLVGNTDVSKITYEVKWNLERDRDVDWGI
jgi:hypothetical protein